MFNYFRMITVLYLCSQHLPKIFSQKMSSVPAGGFPNTIEGYGYRFNGEWYNTLE